MILIKVGNRMIRAENLNNILMLYEEEILWIKYADNGIEITNLNTQTILEGTAELEVLRYIIDKLSIVSDEEH